MFGSWRWAYLLQGKEVCGFIELLTFNVHNFKLNGSAVLIKESKNTLWWTANQCNFILKLFKTFSFTFSYDTAVEQVAVIKQLTELFIVEEDEFQYGSAILDLAIALDGLIDTDLGEDKWV